MPIYEYKCQQCGREVEKRQSVSDEPLVTCEACNGPLEKKWSLSGFQFKGEGWYVTDYAGKKSKSAESTTSPDAASKPNTDTAAPAAKETAAKPTSE